MKKTIMCVMCVMCVALVAGFWTLRGLGGDKEPSKQSEFMRKKLEHSQKVLEGIAIADFDKISKHAGELLILSKLAEWRTLNTPRYELHSNEFRRATQSLIDEAKAKNLDGAALAYVDLTLNCVKCHKHVREVRMTRLSGASRDALSE